MIELHYHLDGGIRLKTAYELIKPYRDIRIEELENEMVMKKPCKDLATLLKAFDIPLKIMQKKENMERISEEAVLDLYSDGVTYCEIRFAPHSHIREGLTQKEVIESVISGVEKGIEKTKGKIKVGLILCMMRGLSYEENLETIELAKDFKNTIVCGMDLCGDEYSYPLKIYEREFLKMKEYGIPFTIHCGEVNQYENMVTALDWGCKRFGHAVYSILYPDILKRMKEEQVLIETCITSNYKTKAITHIENHPIRKLFEYGINILPCVDDSTIVDSKTSKEIDLCKTIFGFTEIEIEKVEKKALEYRFLS